MNTNKILDNLDRIEKNLKNYEVVKIDENGNEISESTIPGINCLYDFINIIREMNKKDSPRFEIVSRLNKEEAKLPRRGTEHSAGYDFFLLDDLVIEPKQRVIIPTGIKAYMPEDVVLLLFIRSSTGIKFHTTLSNNVAVIDADFYNNKDNEGEISLALVNNGEATVKYKAGDRLAQGVFINFLKVLGDDVKEVRLSGIGSTSK